MFSHVYDQILKEKKLEGLTREVAMWHTRSAMLCGSVACPLLARCRCCRGGAAPPPADDVAPPGAPPLLAAGPPRLCGDTDPPCQDRWRDRETCIIISRNIIGAVKMTDETFLTSTVSERVVSSITCCPNCCCTAAAAPCIPNPLNTACSPPCTHAQEKKPKRSAPSHEKY